MGWNLPHTLNVRPARLLLPVTSLLLILFFTQALYGQDRKTDTFSFDFRGEPLAEILEKIAMTARVDIVYDPQLAEGRYIYSRVDERTIPEILNEILEDTALDFLTLSSGTIVIIKTPKEEPSHGSFSGKVVDSQSGEPLPGATVMLADASGGTSTNRSGNFNLNQLVTGTYTILFSYVGYEPVIKTIEVRPEQQNREVVNLERKPVDFTPVIVTAHTPQMPRDAGSTQSLNPDPVDWIVQPGMQDALRSLTLFTGVQYGLPMTDLHLQGGQKGDHRLFLDGVPVYNPYSFGQMFSAFSPYAIGNVELHKAGFGAREGSQISGIVKLQHDVANRGESAWLIQGDPLSLNSRFDLSPGDSEETGLKLMGAFRTNYWNLYRNPTLEETLSEWDEIDPLTMNLYLDPGDNASAYQTLEHNSDVQFYDVHLTSTYQIDTFNSLEASLYTGRNTVRTELLGQNLTAIEEPEYVYASDKYIWDNFMARARHDWLATSRLDLSTQMSYTSNALDHRYTIGSTLDPVIPDLFVTTSSEYKTEFRSLSAQDNLPEQLNDNRIRHGIFRTDANYNVNRKVTLEAGFQLDQVRSGIDISDLFHIPVKLDQRSSLASFYLDNSLRTGEYWHFTLGSRLTYAHNTGRVYPEPRAGIQYDRPESSIGYWSVLLSGGLYRQFINQFDWTNPGPTAIVPSFSIWYHSGPSAEPPKAYHLSSSFLIEPSDRTTASFEIFYKWQPITYITAYNSQDGEAGFLRTRFDSFAERTTMTSYGVSTRLNHRFNNPDLNLMLGYDYSFSEIDMEARFGRSLSAPWNEPHRFQARSLWRVTEAFRVVAKWQSILGRSWGYRQVYYDFLADDSTGRFDNPEDDILSAFHQLDFSLIFRPGFGSANLEMRLDLINLLNRHNTIDWSLIPSVTETQPEGGSIRKRTMPGFTPSVSIELKF